MERTVFVWLSIVAAAMVGCGGKVVIDADGGADDVTSCDRACARVVAACGEDEASCVAQCEQNAQQGEANGCADANDQLVSCIADASDEPVCGSGMNVPASCQSLYQQWDGCQ
jgi:hypothetical protein